MTLTSKGNDMEPKHYNYEDVLQSLKEIVHGKGEDYVYQSPDDNLCVYYDQDTGQPSCLVGHFVHKEGLISFDEIEPYEHDNALAMTTTLAVDGIAYFDQRSIDLLQMAQSSQDEGTPWGDALARAIDLVNSKDYGWGVE